MDTQPAVSSPSTGRRFSPAVRIGAVVGFLALIGVAVWALQGGLAGSSDTPRVGTRAPDFTLQNVDGKEVNLASFRGHPVIINYWATWCPPCRAEMPAISAVARGNPDVVVLAVDVLEGPALVKPYVQQMSLGFTPLLDPEGRIGGQYKVNSLPSSFFVGRDGTIRAINIGPMDQPTIEANVQKAS